MRRLLVMGLLVAAGCSDPGPLPEGEPCEADSGCVEGLVCQYGRCRDDCRFDSECGGGACAVRADDPSGGVCINAEVCEAGSGEAGCPAGLSCGPDGLCRVPCQPPYDCGGGRVCALGHCMDSAQAAPFCDGDGDGFFDAVACFGTGCSSCGDCDDGNATVNPGADELCDGLDTDCRSGPLADEVDLDGDGALACGGDCDDGDATIYEGAEELCDGVDNDCDGLVPADELDGDDDGVSTCAGDCDDSDATISPAAIEVCDGLDNDCDGEAEAPITPLGEPVALGEVALEMVGPSMVWTPHGFALASAWRDELGWWLDLHLVDGEGVATQIALMPSAGRLLSPRLVWTGERFLVMAIEETLGELLVIEVSEVDGGWTQVVTNLAIACGEEPGRPQELDVDFDGASLGLVWLEALDSGPTGVCAAELDPLTRDVLASTPLEAVGEAPRSPSITAGVEARSWWVTWVDTSETSTELAVAELGFGEEDVVIGLDRVARVAIRAPQLAVEGERAGLLWLQTVSDEPALRFGAVAFAAGVLEVTVEGSPTPLTERLRGDVLAMIFDGEAYLAAWYSPDAGGQLRLAMRPASRPGVWPASTVAALDTPPSDLALAPADEGWGLSYRLATTLGETTTEQLYLVVADGCR